MGRSATDNKQNLGGGGGEGRELQPTGNIHILENTVEETNKL